MERTKDILVKFVRRMSEKEAANGSDEVCQQLSLLVDQIEDWNWVNSEEKLVAEAAERVFHIYDTCIYDTYISQLKQQQKEG